MPPRECVCVRVDVCMHVCMCYVRVYACIRERGGAQFHRHDERTSVREPRAPTCVCARGVRICVHVRVIRVHARMYDRGT